MQRRIETDPSELVFEDVELNKKYTKSVTLTNKTGGCIDLSLKPCPTLDRDYEIFPNNISLGPKESFQVSISLTTSKQGVLRDVIHITSVSFSEKLYVNIKGYEPTNKHYQNIVKHKDDQLQSSQTRIERLEEEIEELSEKLRQANLIIDQKARIEQELVRVQQENSEIRAALQELQRTEVYNIKIKDMMKESVPSLESLIELTLQQEREKNERKNEKILEILQIKDSLIEDLEDKNAELQNALTLMQHKLTDNKVLLTNTEKSLQSAQKIIEDLKTDSFEKDQTISSLRNKGLVPNKINQEDSAVLKNELKKNFDHIKQLNENLSKYEQENLKLREREEYVLELSNRHNRIREDHEKTIKEKDLIITELQSKVSTQTEHIESLIVKLSSLNYSEILTKVSKLEEENKNLSKLLADSHRSSDTFKKEELDDFGTQKIQDLEAENLKLSLNLREVIDQTNQLENLVSSKNKEIISLQNELIDQKKIKSEAIIKAAPSPQEEISKISASLQEEQIKALRLEDENKKLFNEVKSLEYSNKQLSSEISFILDNADSSDLASSNNHLLIKIANKIKNLQTKEQDALKAAAIAEEGIKALQNELYQEKNSELHKEIKKLQTELFQIRSKNEVFNLSYSKLKEELEEKKQLIINIQFALASDEKPGKKLKKRPKVPAKVIKSLITAKISESEAIKKLRTAGKYNQELRENLLKKEEQCRTLEKEIKTLKRPSNSYTPSESNIELQSDDTLQRKVLNLELEIQDIKETEAISWNNYNSISLMWKNESYKPIEDYDILIEGFLYLIDQFTYIDIETKTESIEKAQRVLIRSLSNTLKSSGDGEVQHKTISYKPSREEDRKIWYVELLESQIDITVGIIDNLIEKNKKPIQDIAATVSSAASYKAASLELAKATKQAAEEIDIIKIICSLIKNDLETLIGPEYSEKINTYNKKMQEEIKKGLLQKSKKINEIKLENNTLKQEIKILYDKNENYDNELKNYNLQAAQYKNKVNRLETEKDELQKGIESLCVQVKELNYLKEQALFRVDKVHEEMKEWQNNQLELLALREKTILDLQAQVKALRDEKMTKANDSIYYRPLENNIDEIDAKKISNFQDIIQKLQQEIYSLKEKSEQEKADLIYKVSSLEENIAYFKKSETSKGNFESTLKKDPDVQISSLQALLREKINSLDEESRKRIEAETKLRSLLITESEAEKQVDKIQSELYQKINELEKELYSNNSELKKLINEKDELMNRYEHVTKSLKEATENLRIAERDILTMQQDRKTESIKLTEKLQSSNSASVELRFKVKEITENNQKLIQENETLYKHLKSLENEHENSHLKIEDLESICATLKKKINEYEITVQDLEEMRDIDTNNHINSLENLKLELKATYEEFEKTIEQFDGQIASLKEQFYNELKQKKNSKKTSETIDYMLQISKKDSIIKSLKTELKLVKPKKLEKKVKKQENIQKEEENILLQNQIYRLRAQTKNLESQLSAAKDDLEKISQEAELRPSSEATSKKEILEIEKRHRLDMQKLAEEVNRLREKWHSPEEWNQLMNTNKELESNIKKLNDDVARKKEMVDNLKAIKDQQDYENTAIQEELEQIKDYSEKTKKLKLEITRKDKAITDLKTALEASKELEKKLFDDNTQMAEKIKTLKTDITRKETLIKDLKYKLESSGIDNIKIVTDECENLKDKIKKLKADCERKDLQLKNLKAKLETTEIEFESLQAERQNVSVDAFASLERELKKNEKLQSQVKRFEAQFQSLYGITRRIFKDLSESVESLRSKAGQTIEKEYYSDCMDILNMDMKDLSEFVGHRSVGTILCRIERLLEQGEDTAEIIDIFNKLLEERLDLEKNFLRSKLEDRHMNMRSKTSQGILKSFKY